jgi:2-amino-4-hydroxy-6-hydroxymethyldihydropteridine diphosphokinase
MGRERKEKYGPRNIDIDILLYNNEIISEPLLNIPHPEMTRRRFVLTPLAEIAPNLIHPILHLSIKNLLEQCPDTLEVRQLG